MRTKTRQLGITFWGVSLILVMVGFIAMIAMALAPVYADDMKLVEVLKSMSNQGNALSQEEIQQQFDRRMITEFSGPAPVSSKTLKFDQQDGKLLVGLKYEVRVHIAYNVDAVVVFDHKQSFHQ